MLLCERQLSLRLPVSFSPLLTHKPQAVRSRRNKLHPLSLRRLNPWRGSLARSALVPWMQWPRCLTVR